MLTARSSLLARRSSLPALPRSTTSTPSVRLLGRRLAGGNLYYPTRSAIIRASSSSSSYNSNTAGSSNTRRHSSWNITAAAATVVLSVGLLSTLLAQPLLAEEAKKSSSQAPFTKEDIGVICIIGGPSSGKTTQLENAAKRFNLTTLDAKKQDLKKEIEKLINDGGGKSSSGYNENKEKIRVIIEGFPKTIEQANKFQDEVVPILLIISIVLNAPKGIDRVKGDDESLRRDAKINWKRFEDNSEELIKQFRFQGNILEITGEWPEDEVWEQVEAKLESALELDDRGEL